MEYIKNITVKHFNKDIFKEGVPIKIIYYKGTDIEFTDIGIVQTNYGEVLKYAKIVKGEIKSYSINVDCIGIGAKITIGKFD